VQYRSRMKLSSDTRADVNAVLGYGPAEVRLRTGALATSAIVTADRVVDWQVKSLAEVTPAALDRVLELQPEIVLLATGATQRFPEPDAYAHVQGRGVGFEAMEIGAACRTYNVLLGENRRVALALLFET
jgi:uncharacterized protein